MSSNFDTGILLDSKLNPMAQNLCPVSLAEL